MIEDEAEEETIRDERSKINDELTLYIGVIGWRRVERGEGG